MKYMFNYNYKDAKKEFYIKYQKIQNAYDKWLKAQDVWVKKFLSLDGQIKISGNYIAGKLKEVLEKNNAFQEQAYQQWKKEKEEWQFECAQFESLYGRRGFLNAIECQRESS